METLTMPRRKEVWVSAREAASILTANTDHEVSADYVRLIAKTGRIEARERNGRENEYLKSDVEKYRVRPQNTPRVRPRPSTRKPRNEPEKGGGIAPRQWRPELTTEYAIADSYKESIHHARSEAPVTQ